jgi:hypothetical protein
MILKRIFLLLIIGFWMLEPMTESFHQPQSPQRACAVCGTKNTCNAECCKAPSSGSGLSAKFDPKICSLNCNPFHSRSLLSERLVKWFPPANPVLSASFKSEIRVSFCTQPTSVILSVLSPPPRRNDLG